MNVVEFLTHVDLQGDWKNWPYGFNARWPNFRPWEFRSAADDEFLISCTLLDGLQRLRAMAETGLYVNQPEHNLHRRGFRTMKANADAGGSSMSQHMSGRASDVDARGVVSPRTLAQMARDIVCFDRGGIILYETFVHLDVRPNGPYHK